MDHFINLLQTNPVVGYGVLVGITALWATWATKNLF